MGLTEEQIETNYKNFIDLVKTNVTRQGVDALLDWLDHSDVKSAPASTKFHLSTKGGLVLHSLNVYHRLKELLALEQDTTYTEESVVLVALFHDISKINFYEIQERNTTDSNGNWIKVPFYQVKENKFIYGSHPQNSAYMLSKFIDISFEESLAILQHEGSFEAYGNPALTATTTEAFKKSRLALLLHQADLYATCAMEGIDE